METSEILKNFNNKKICRGGEVFLDREDSLRFILECEKLALPIYRIEIVQLTDSKTLSSLDKIIDYEDQEEVYSSARNFIVEQMNTQWNYASFVIG